MAKITTHRIFCGTCADCEDGRIVTYGSAYGELPTPTRSGYLFDGWYTTADFKRGSEVNGDDVIQNSDTTLYAKWNRRALWYEDPVFHVEAAAQWDGYILDAQERIIGTLNVKVSKPNRGYSTITATIIPAGDKKQTFKGSTYDGTFISTDGRLHLSLGANGMSGTFDGNAIDGSRNYFNAKDEDSKVTAAKILKKWQGTYMLVLGDDNGYGGFSITVGNNGKTTVKGNLPSGTAISTSGQLLVGERECAFAISWVKKTESIAFLVWFCEDGTVECSNLDGDYRDVLIANAKLGAYLESGSKFRVEIDNIATKMTGTVLKELSPNGLAVNMNGMKFDIAKAGKVKLNKAKTGLDEELLGDNPSGLKLSYTIKNCTFTGSFKLYSLDGTRIKSTSVSVKGVVVGGKGYGSASVKKVGSTAVRIE